MVKPEDVMEIEDDVLKSLSCCIRPQLPGPESIDLPDDALLIKNQKQHRCLVDKVMENWLTVGVEHHFSCRNKGNKLVKGRNIRGPAILFDDLGASPFESLSPHKNTQIFEITPDGRHPGFQCRHI